MKRIDSHVHVWNIARGDYGWLAPTPAMSPIYRDFSLDDLRPALTSAGIGAAVLVQAAPTVAETRFLLDVARNSGGLVRGVVGWADLAAPDAVPIIEKLAANRLLKSMRPMLQDLEDPCWITQPQVAIALRALAGLGLRFDALVTPRDARVRMARIVATASSASASRSSRSLSIIAPNRTLRMLYGSRGQPISPLSPRTHPRIASCPDS